MMVTYGNPKDIFQSCDSVLNTQTGEIEEMSAHQIKFMYAWSDMVRFCSNVIAFSFSYPKNFDNTDSDNNGVLKCEQSGQTLLCLVGFEDFASVKLLKRVKQLEGELERAKG